MWSFLLSLGYVSIWVLSSSILFPLPLLCLYIFFSCSCFSPLICWHVPKCCTFFSSTWSYCEVLRGFVCVTMDRVALRLSAVTIKHLAGKQSVLECWDGMVLLCSSFAGSLSRSHCAFVPVLLPGLMSFLSNFWHLVSQKPFLMKLQNITLE